MFAYCLNNPVCYKDDTGFLVEIEDERTANGYSVTIRITESDSFGKATVVIVFDFKAFEEYQVFLNYVDVSVSGTNIDITMPNGECLSFGYTPSGLIPDSLTIPFAGNDYYDLNFIASEDGFGLEISAPLSDSTNLTIDMQYRYNFVVRTVDRIFSELAPKVSGLAGGVPRWQDTGMYANLSYASMCAGNTFGGATYMFM